MDYAAWDNYVGQPNGDNYRIQLRASMEHSFDRYLSNGKNKFLVAEQLAVTDANTPPEVIQAQTWLNVSHGAFGTIFFEWRSPTGGFEQAYQSVLGKDKKFRDETTPVIKRLCTNLSEHYYKINGAETVSPVAVVYSYENSWGTNGWTVDGFYDEEIFSAYGGFKNELNQNIDIIGIDADFSKYKAIILLNHRITTELQAQKVSDYVKKGGIVILNTESGTRFENNQMRELCEPGLFAEICGAKVTGSISASALENQTDSPCYVDYGNKKVQVKNNIFRLKVSTAETIAVYTNGLLAKTPGITINKHGNGYAVLCGTDGNDTYYYEALANYMKERFHIEPLIDADDGIIVSSRIKEGTEYIFATNMKSTPGFVYLPYPMKDELTEKIINENAELNGYETFFLKKV